MKLKVVTVVGTRPEIIRLSRVISEFDQAFEHTLIHTGQNYDYELNQVFFDDLSIRKPDLFLEAAGENAAETIGKIIISIDSALERISPDALLVLGDTNSCLCVIPAKRRKIPIFHMEAGNRCFDMRVPEEINRRIVDHTADINLPYSTIAREYLLAEGISPDTVIKTGSPMFEVLQYYLEQIRDSDVLARLGLESEGYFLISAHREENVEAGRITRLTDLLNRLSSEYEVPVVVSTHPRTMARISESGAELSDRVRLLKPLGFHDYNQLQISAKATLSDSGTITEESSILNFPALNIREAHERPEGMEEGAVMMVGMDAERVLSSLEILARQPRGDTRLILPVADYQVPNVSSKMVRIVQSYSDYVRRTTWKQYA